jgi:hypothetical protein
MKRAKLIDRILVFFSNAFHSSTYKSKFYDDDESYVIFGGVNETQIVHGAAGLFKMPIAGRDLNTQNFWGVVGQGFLYGDTFYFDPHKHDPVLAIIDSGTTLVLVPRKVYDGLIKSIIKKTENDPKVQFVCTKDDQGDFDSCWFNNTRCVDIHEKMEPMRFIFGGIVFEIKVQAFLKDLLEDNADQT